MKASYIYKVLNLSFKTSYTFFFTVSYYKLPDLVKKKSKNLQLLFSYKILMLQYIEFLKILA